MRGELKGGVQRGVVAVVGCAGSHAREIVDSERSGRQHGVCCRDRRERVPGFARCRQTKTEGRGTPLFNAQ